MAIGIRNFCFCCLYGRHIVKHPLLHPQMEYVNGTRGINGFGHLMAPLFLNMRRRIWPKAIIVSVLCTLYELVIIIAFQLERPFFPTKTHKETIKRKYEGVYLNLLID